MNRRTLAVVLVLIAAGLVGYWAVKGGTLFTQEQVAVKTVDPLFGTESVTWKDEYHPGLLDTALGPVAGVLLVAAIGLFWSASRGRRASAPAATGGSGSV
jgi:hypothetical protein